MRHEFLLSILCLYSCLPVPIWAWEAVPKARKVERTDAAGDPLPVGAIARLGTVRFRHHGIIHSAAMSPDGQIVATGGGEGWSNSGHPIRLWDAKTGREIRQLRGYRDPVGRVIFSPDGKILASVIAPGSSVLDEKVHIWDVKTGRLLHEFANAKDSAELRDWTSRDSAIAFSPDGRVLASLGNDSILRCWSVTSGEELHQWPLPDGAPALAFCPDGKSLGLIEAGAIRLRERATGKLLKEIPGDPMLHSLHFTAGGIIVTGCLDGTVRWWDPVKKSEAGRVRGDLLACCHQGKRVAILRGERVELWDAVRRERIRTFPSSGFWSTWHWSAYYSGGLSPDGSVLAASDWNAVRVVNTATGKEVCGADGHTRPVLFVGFPKDDNRVVSVGDETIRWWDGRTGKQTNCVLAHRYPMGGAVMNASGTELATSGPDGYVRLWNASSALKLREWDVGRQMWSLLAFSPNERRLAANCVPGNPGPTWRLWDLDSGKEVSRFGRDTGHFGIAFWNRGKVVVSLQYAEVNGHELPGDRKWAGFQALNGLGHQQAWATTPDGRLVATGWTDRNGLWHVGLWEIASETLVHRWLENQDDIVSLAFSADGGALACGSGSGTVQIWSILDGALRAKFSGHRGAVRSLSFSRDGRVLASGGSDGSTLLWDLTRSHSTARVRETRLTITEFQDLWTQLSRDEAAAAYPAICKLSEARSSVPEYLASQLWNETPDAVRIRTYIERLNHSRFKIRDSAAHELIALGTPSVPALQRFLDSNPSLDIRKRAEVIVETIRTRRNPARGQQLRGLRTVLILESIRTPEAIRVLERLAKSEGRKDLRDEASDALERLHKLLKKP